MATAIAERRHGFGFITPLLVMMLAAFNLPIFYMLALGFWSKQGGFTLEHYEALIDAPIYLRVLGNTLRVSVVATLVNVAIGYGNNRLKMTIVDDGKGLPDTNGPSRAHGGNGLRNMRKRAEEMNAELHMDSTPEKGTTIDLVIPL